MRFVSSGQVLLGKFTYQNIKLHLNCIHKSEQYKNTTCVEKPQNICKKREFTKNLFLWWKVLSKKI